MSSIDFPCILFFNRYISSYDSFRHSFIRHKILDVKYFILTLIVCFLFSGCATTAGIIIGLNCKKSVELQSIEPDTDIEITLRNLNTIEGTFNKVQDKNLYLVVDGEEKAIPVIDIKNTEIPDLTWRWISIGTGYAIDSILFYYLVLRPLQEMEK